MEVDTGLSSATGSGTLVVKKEPEETPKGSSPMVKVEPSTSGRRQAPIFSLSDSIIINDSSSDESRQETQKENDRKSDRSASGDSSPERGSDFEKPEVATSQGEVSPRVVKPKKTKGKRKKKKGGNSG